MEQGAQRPTFPRSPLDARLRARAQSERAGPCRPNNRRSPTRRAVASRRLSQLPAQPPCPRRRQRVQLDDRPPPASARSTTCSRDQQGQQPPASTGSHEDAGAPASASAVKSAKRHAALVKEDRKSGAVASMTASWPSQERVTTHPGNDRSGALRPPNREARLDPSRCNDLRRRASGRRLTAAQDSSIHGKR